jgi:hypothetical protein
MVRKSFAVIAFVLAVYLAGATPVLGATENQRFTAFLARSTSAMLDINEDMSSSNDALEYEDYGESAYYSTNIASHAKAYATWLDKNKPAPCYKNAWTWSRKYAVNVRDAETAIARWLNAWPWGTDADYNTYDKNTTAALKSLKKAAYYVERSHC